MSQTSHGFNIYVSCVYIYVPCVCIHVLCVWKFGPQMLVGGMVPLTVTALSNVVGGCS